MGICKVSCGSKKYRWVFIFFVRLVLSSIDARILIECINYIWENEPVSETINYRVCAERVVQTRRC